MNYSLQNQKLRGVYYVRSATQVTPVFESIFQSGDRQHKNKRNHGDFFPKGLNGRHPIEDNNEEKVNVCQAVELLKEVSRKKGEKIVFCGRDSYVSTTNGAYLLVHFIFEGGILLSMVDINKPIRAGVVFLNRHFF